MGSRSLDVGGEGVVYYGFVAAVLRDIMASKNGWCDVVFYPIRTPAPTSPIMVMTESKPESSAIEVRDRPGPRTKA